jgi:transposase
MWRATYPFAGDVFVFRGRSGSLIKALWHDGIGLSLYAKYLVSH